MSPLTQGLRYRAACDGQYYRDILLTRDLLPDIKQYSKLSSKLLELETSNLVHSFLLENPSGRSNNFPQKGRGLGHVTPKIFGIQSNLSSKLLDLAS